MLKLQYLAWLKVNRVQSLKFIQRISVATFFLQFLPLDFKGNLSGNVCRTRVDINVYLNYSSETR